MRQLSFLHKTAAENFQRYHPKYTARPISSPPKTQSNPKAKLGESSKPDPKDERQTEATLAQTAKAEGRLMPQKETQEKSRKLWEGYGKTAANKNTDKEFAANYKLVPVMQEKTTLSTDEVQWLSGPLRVSLVVSSKHSMSIPRCLHQTHGIQKQSTRGDIALMGSSLTPCMQKKMAKRNRLPVSELMAQE